MSYILTSRTLLRKPYRNKNTIRTSKRHVAHWGEDKLTWAVLTPRTIGKSMQGGVVTRLLSTPGLEIVGARMYAPSQEFVSEMMAAHNKYSEDKENAEAIKDFVELNFGQEKSNAPYPNHCMLCLLKGPDALNTVNSVAGPHFPSPAGFGRTIRGTFGEYKKIDGKVLRFQPSIFVPDNERLNDAFLELFAKYAEKDGGILSNEWYEKNYPDTNGDGILDKHETSLVMIKPDSLERPSSLPGHIMDLLGTTGLTVVGTRLISMSLNDAKNFYGFLEGVFEKKLRPKVQQTIKKQLSNAFEFEVTDEEIDSVTDIFQKKNAKKEVTSIMEYMSGLDIDKVTDPDAPGPAKCWALLYRGEKAISSTNHQLFFCGLVFLHLTISLLSYEE